MKPRNSPTVQRQDYPAATVTLRYLEKQLLTEAQIAELLDCHSIDEFIEILHAAGYDKMQAGSLGPGTYDTLLTHSMERFCREIISLSPGNSEYLDLFLLHYDLYNIKAILLTLPEGYTTYPVIAIPPERAALYELLAKDVEVPAEPHSWYIQLFEECRTLQAQHGDKALQEYLDKVYYRRLQEIAENSGVDFFKKLVSVKIDFYNLSATLRLRNLHTFTEVYKDEEALRTLSNKVWIEGGTLDTDTLLALYSVPLAELADSFAYTDYAHPLAKGIRTFMREDRLTILEKEMDDYLTALYAAQQYVGYGPEPFLGYLRAREIEIINIKLIFTAYFTGIDRKIINERLRKPYV